MRVDAEEAFWSYELGVVLANLHAAHRRLGTRPRPPVPIAPWASRGRRPRRRLRDGGVQAVFGGVEDDTSTDDPQSPPDSRGDPLNRVQVMALLYGNPETPCSVTQVARVFGLRDKTVRDCRPHTAAEVGRSLMAPFSHWCKSLQRARVIPAWPAELEAPPLSPETRAHAPVRRAPARLRPLGGPSRG